MWTEGPSKLSAHSYPDRGWNPLDLATKQAPALPT